MFYSQFILAKKGPLGTIWIAAHLERKLRKNQVADTDIGVSVDSILFPDVPIALRLSSHLLLGVVRIYSRKVNYLFDDCSEALLKVKQAFRSAAVDLPPEESKAPYHSITLPETFDLDDFELPDNDIFQGNYVDHHISSREQITLQDNMDGIGYSTSKFGLDERFGDGDASGLDLDEELFLDKIGSSGQADESGDPQASVQPMTPLKLDEHPQERTNSETMVDVVEDADVMDYAQAPCTPGLVEEPNFSNVQEASACDDHLEAEDHLMESNVKENAKNVTSEDKQEADWCSRDDVNSTANPWMPPDENGYHSGGLEIEQIKPHEESPCMEAAFEPVKYDKPSSVSKPSSDLSNQVKAVNQASELVDKINKESVVPAREDLQNEVVNNDKSNFPSANEPGDGPQGPSEIVMEDSAQNTFGLTTTCQQVCEVVTLTDQASIGVEGPVSVEDSAQNGGQCSKMEDSAQNTSGLTTNCQQVSEVVTLTDQASIGVEGPVSMGNAGDLDKSCPDASEIGSKDLGSCSENPETQAYQEPKHSNILNPDVHEDMASTGTQFRSSNLEQPHIPNSRCGMSMNPDFQSDTAALGSLEISGREETATLGEACHATDDSEQISKENHVEGQVDTIHSEDGQVDNLNNSVEADLPAPEKLLSVIAGHADIHTDILAEASPRDLVGLDEDDTGSKVYSGKKRSLTESTLTEHGLNSVESSRMVRAKRTAESVPDDDDLLSSILVGRRSSVLKVKPTPVVYEVTSVKRARSAPRTGTAKRKVLMDDTMVLHGDMIRQQLMNTEDVRRVRKKAPCTRPEISMIQKQHLEDEIFLEPIFTGLSIELASLHSQEYDLSGIRICQNDVNGDSLDTVAEPNFHNDENNAFVEDAAELRLASHNDENGMNRDIRKDEGSSGPNVAEQSGIGAKSELLADKNNEVAGHSEVLVDESMLETSHAPSVEVNICQEQMYPTNDGVEPDVSHQELLQDVVELETSDKYADAVNPAVIEGVVSSSIIDHTSGDMDDVPAGMLQPASLNETNETNSSVNVDLPVTLPDQKIDAPFVELDISVVDVSNEKAIGTDEVTEKNGDIIVEDETEPGTLFNVLSEVAGHGASVELLPDSNHGVLECNVQGETDNVLTGEQPTEGSYLEQSNVHLEDGFLNNDENPIQKDGCLPNMTDAEIASLDLHDRDGLDYSAPVNDTEFLNVDDEEVAEIADDYMPDAEDTRLTENSGWSSRTRAVSKYLQTLFEKEAECGRKSLSMDNLLIGKTRKEASRMFFEALVLKTRDYIHVEQRNPVDDITIKPRMKLKKSNF
ncbi:Sister chromatid cohesion 1 protein 4 [Abeliophyllum distichum]|uniref:Sister chromatid cohesion 1 protein 4 n=1 Tax=Abeliophyllum distichum TaxID=126358 RepID=A0ABD1UMP7_9LAMI